MWKTATILFSIVLILATLGIIMLASTSSAQAGVHGGDAAFFLKRQVPALVLGLLAAFVGARIDYRLWNKVAVPMGLVTMVMLIMVITPGVGKSVKGSHRWLQLGPLPTFQPSELAKFALIVLLAWWMSRIQRRAAEVRRGLLVPVLLMGVITGLVFIEPDFGTTLLLGTVGLSLMFIGGTRLGYLLITAALGGSAVSLAILHNEERMRRIIAFLDPEKYAKDEAFQLLNALYAFVVGGAGGVGFGHSMQKLHYLPEAHTDFIFAIIGEELGLAASLGVVGLFIAFFACGLRISLRATDMFGRLVAFGIAITITLQAAINVGVVTGCLPTKGLPLPFISYGGTSLVITFLMVGVLINIAMQSGGEDADDELPVVKDNTDSL